MPTINQLVKFGRLKQKRKTAAPALNMIIADRDEVLHDGTTLTHFSIIITKTAAAILDQPTT